METVQAPSKPMLIPHTILFQSDQFWENSDLDVLRMLMSTCKSFRAEFSGQGTLLDYALSAQPHSRYLTLSLTKAKYRFSLKLDVTAKHCAMLPSDDELHIAAEDMQDIKGNYHRYYIRFIDAYHLACENGLKAAMERRHRVYKKVLDSGREIAAVLDGRLQPLMMNARAAQIELSALCEKELLKGVRLLKKLWTDLGMARYMLTFVCDQITSNMPEIQLTERYVTKLKRLRRTLIARYRVHTVYCPALLTTGCLDGLPNRDASES